MFIYKITNQINQKIYIGQTIETIKKRWHKHGKNNRNDHITNAIRKYGKDNFIIEEIDRAETILELNKKEIYWIAFYNATDRTIGYNIKEGGNNCPCPEETKIKIGLANKGRKPSNQTIEAARAVKLGQKLSPETCAKMSLAKTGVEFSQETRDKIGDAHRGKTVSNEAREKMREAKLGTKQSVESVEKRRLANTGQKRSEEFKQTLRDRVITEETKMKISQKNKGRKHSEETKERQRLAFKGGRTGQKNSPESIAKMKETKRLKKLAKLEQETT